MQLSNTSSIDTVLHFCCVGRNGNVKPALVWCGSVDWWSPHPKSIIKTAFSWLVFRFSLGGHVAYKHCENLMHVPMLRAALDTYTLVYTIMVLWVDVVFRAYSASVNWDKWLCRLRLASVNIFQFSVAFCSFVRCRTYYKTADTRWMKRFHGSVIKKPFTSPRLWLS